MDSAPSSALERLEQRTDRLTGAIADLTEAIARQSAAISTIGLENAQISGALNSAAVRIGFALGALDASADADAIRLGREAARTLREGLREAAELERPRGPSRAARERGRPLNPQQLLHLKRQLDSLVEIGDRPRLLQLREHLFGAAAAAASTPAVDELHRLNSGSDADRKRLWHVWSALVDGSEAHEALRASTSAAQRRQLVETCSKRSRVRRPAPGAVAAPTAEAPAARQPMPVDSDSDSESQSMCDPSPPQTRTPNSPSDSHDL